MKKALIILVLIALLAFSACQTQPVVEDDSTVPIYRIKADTDAQERVQTHENSNDLKEFTITVGENLVDPATIEVNQGDHVRLNIINDLEKEKYVDEYGRQRIRHLDFAITIPGVENEEITYAQGAIFYDFVAKDKGTYNFVCTSGCVPGTVELDNLIIVK